MNRLLAVAIVIASFAPPAFAQSFDPEMGRGNVLPFSYEPVATHGDRARAKHNGLNAFAMAPRTRAVDDPALNGGGSFGYNENLRTNY